MCKYITFALIILSYFDIINSKFPWEPEVDTNPRHAYLVNLTKSFGKKIQIIFLGGSQIYYWSDHGKEAWIKYYSNLGAFNYGVYGDRTQHIIWRLVNGEVDGLHPKLVVLLTGETNLDDNGK